MNLKKQVLIDAQKEKERENLVDDYGNVMYILGYPINISLGVIGGVFDALIIFSIIQNSFDSKVAGVIAAIVLSSMIQFLMGRPVMLITKNFYTGKFQTKKGFGKMLLMMLIGSMVAVGCSLYLSWNTDQLVKVAISPTFAANLKSEKEVNIFFQAQRDTLKSDYEKEKTRLENRVKDLDKDFVFEKGIKVKSWPSRQTKKDIESKQIPTLTKNYNTAINEKNRLEEAEKNRVIKHNTDTKEDKNNVINWGGTATRFTNIGINLFRVVIVVFYMIFILDATDEQEEQEPEQSTGTTIHKTKKTTSQPVRTVVHASQNNITEQAQSFVAQSAQPIGTAIAQPNSAPPYNLNSGTGTTEQPLRTARPIGFRTATPPSSSNNPNSETGTAEQPVRTVVHEKETTKIIVNNTDLVNMRKLAKQAYLRSFFPSNDYRYKKLKSAPPKETLDRNDKLFWDRVEELRELGLEPKFSGNGKDRTVKFL